MHRTRDDAAHHPWTGTAALIVATLIVAALISPTAVITAAARRMPGVSGVPTAAAMDARDMVRPAAAMPGSRKSGGHENGTRYAEDRQ
jgi:hypothetical protein